MGVLVGLLMQYPCGRIKPPRIGQQRFVLLPGYERGGGGALGGRSRNETGSRRADIVAPRSRRHRGMTFLLLDPQCRRFP